MGLLLWTMSRLQWKPLRQLPRGSVLSGIASSFGLFYQSSSICHKWNSCVDILNCSCILFCVAYQGDYIWENVVLHVRFFQRRHCLQSVGPGPPYWHLILSGTMWVGAEKMSTEIFLSAHFLVLWPVSTLFLCYLNIFSKVVGKLCQSDPVEYNHTIIDFLQKKGKTRKNQRNFDPQVWIMIKTFNGIQYIDVWPCWDRADRLMSFKECSAFTSWYKIQNPA